jgi:hypothetical protein
MGYVSNESNVQRTTVMLRSELSVHHGFIQEFVSEETKRGGSVSAGIFHRSLALQVAFERRTWKPAFSLDRL